MRILVLGDVESKALWDFFDKERVKDIDLIISCGDLDADYLSFLVTLANVPVFYVHGNHDNKYEKHPPEGCTCIDDKLIVYEGIRIIGLGGSMRYRPGAFQYTEREMRERVFRLLPSLLWHRGFDILVSHAPAYQINDGTDLPHQGFKVFRSLMDRYKPKFFLHGHVHLNYNRSQKRVDQYKQTTIINAYERYVIEI